MENDKTIPLVMEFRGGADGKPPWRATVNADGSVTLPDGMTGREALLVLTNISVPAMFDAARLTPWARKTIKKWVGSMQQNAATNPEPSEASHD